MEQNITKIVAIPVMQNQQEFMVGTFTISQILDFTMYTKRLINDYDEEGMPIYNDQIQREVEKARVEKIADFLMYDSEATFPTNIVLHIPLHVIEEQNVNHFGTHKFIEVTLSNKVSEGIKQEKQREGSGDVYITIIDGQHRIRGIELAIEKLEKDIKSYQKLITIFQTESELKKYTDSKKRLNDLKNIQIVVSFFIDKTLEYQAMIFSTINRTQKKVSESLVYSLFGLTTDDSPHKSALQITLALNARPKSPFYNRINLYGETYNKNQSPPLSQATMVKSIISLISENAREADKDRYKKRTMLTKPIPNKVLPFRKWYAMSMDTKISDVFFYYFSSVKEVFTDNTNRVLWDFTPENMRPSNVLHTTVGYLALLDFWVKDILPNAGGDEDKLFAKDFYKAILLRVKNKVNFDDLERYPFTSKTKLLLYLDLSIAAFPPSNATDLRLIQRDDALRK